MLAHNWWIFGLRGGLGVVIGSLALTMPIGTNSVLIGCFASYMFLDGVFAIEGGLAIAADHADMVELVLEGVVSLSAGSVALLLPVAAPSNLVWIVGGWAIVSGTLLLIAANRIHGAYGRGFLVLGGVTSTAWGIGLTIASISNTAVMTGWFGVYALVFGSALLGLAFRLRQRHQYRKSPE